MEEKEKKCTTPSCPQFIEFTHNNNLSRLYFPATMGILPWIHKGGKYSFIYLHTILFFVAIMAFCSFLDSSSTEIISSDSRLLSGGTAEK